MVKFAAGNQGCEKAVEPLHVDGFGHEDGAFGQTAFGRDFLLRQGRDHQAGHALELRRLLERAQQFKTVHAGHVQVGNEHVGLDAGHVDEGFEAGGHGGAVHRHFAAVAKVAHHVTRDGIVFHQQDPQPVFAAFDRAHQHVVLLLIFPNRGHGDAAMAPLGFPGLQFVFLDQGLDGAHGQPQQFGCIGGATVVFWRVGGLVCLHGFILMIKVRNRLKNSTLIQTIKQIETI